MIYVGTSTASKFFTSHPFLRRTLSPCSKEIKNRAYKALVRPKMDYGDEVWILTHPSVLDICRDLESVRTVTTRFIHRDYRKSTSSLQLVSNLKCGSKHCTLAVLLEEQPCLPKSMKIFHSHIPLLQPLTSADYIDHPFKLTYKMLL